MSFNLELVHHFDLDPEEVAVHDICPDPNCLMCIVQIYDHHDSERCNDLQCKICSVKLCRFRSLHHLDVRGCLAGCDLD